MFRRSNKSRVPGTGVHDIPTQPSVPKARLVCIGAAMLVALGWLGYRVGPVVVQRYLDANPALELMLDANGLKLAIEICFRMFGTLGVVSCFAGALGLFRRKISYRLLRATLTVVYVLVLAYGVIVWQGLFFKFNDALKSVYKKTTRADVLLDWWLACWPAFATALYVAWLHVLMSSRSVVSAFTRERGSALRGDRVLENVRTHGADPRYRRSVYCSALTHLSILVIIPYLMSLGGCVENFSLPQGSGEMAVVEMMVVKKKKKPKKTLTLRANSAIIFEQPDLDDALTDLEMEEQSDLTYEVSANTGRPGAGGGKQGGWPEGTDKYRIRFLRLNHGGHGWDDGMHASNADVNFLRAFAKSTGFKRIARKGESHSISNLKKYADDGFPPFVYMTGDNRIGRVSSSDYDILREYLLKGGMLIADAGSRRFHDDFTRGFIRRLFPDKRLLVISDDDMIYQLPYGFPNGAPAFWAHGGRRAMGIKHDGRWVVFYHPGDMNDAWKSPDYTDVKPDMRKSAMNLGVNLMFYAFNHWNDAVSKLRK